MDKYQVGHRSQTDRTARNTTVAGRDIAHVSAMSAVSQRIAVARMITERRVRTRIQERLIDICRGVERAVSVWRRLDESGVVALVPEREQPRRAIAVPEIGMREIAAPVNHANDDSLPGGSLRAGATRGGRDANAGWHGRPRPQRPG